MNFSFKNQKWLWLFFFFVFSFLSLVFVFLKSFFMVWVFFEMSLFFFMLLIQKKNLNLFKSYFMMFYDKMLIYFLFQVLGSIMILCGLVLNKLVFLLSLGLLMKFGLYPFFWWFLKVSVSLEWTNLWFLLVLSKVGLFYVFSFFKMSLLVMLVFMKLFLGMFGLFGKLKSLKLIIIYKSVIDTSFMLFLLKFNLSSMMLYFFLYSALSFLSLLFYSFNDYFLLKMKNLFFNRKQTMLLILLMKLGLPPFLGFSYKFMFLSEMLKYSDLMLDYFFCLLVFVLVFFVQGLSYFFFFIPILSKNFLNMFSRFYNIFFVMLFIFLSLLLLMIL